MTEDGRPRTDFPSSVFGHCSEVILSKETITALLWLIPAMLFSTTGELFLKKGMNQVGSFDFATVSTVVPTLVRIFTNPSIWIGFIGFGGGSIFWLSVISRVPLSLAYPILGLGYVVVAVESWAFLGEKFSPLLLLGAIVIGIGVAMVGLSNAGQ
jgi:multidrug transporter EmrE-like cation transporter